MKPTVFLTKIAQEQLQTNLLSLSRTAWADTKPRPKGSSPPALRSYQDSTHCWNLLWQHPTSITLPSQTPVYFFFLFFPSCEVMKPLGRRGLLSKTQKDMISQAHPSSWFHRCGSRQVFESTTSPVWWGHFMASSPYLPSRTAQHYNCLLDLSGMGRAVLARAGFALDFSHVMAISSKNNSWVYRPLNKLKYLFQHVNS